MYRRPAAGLKHVLKRPATKSAPISPPKSSVITYSHTNFSNHFKFKLSCYSEQKEQSDSLTYMTIYFPKAKRSVNNDLQYIEENTVCTVAYTTNSEHVTKH